VYHCLVMARVTPFVGEVSARARPHTRVIALLALGHLPRNAGMASGLIVGFAIGTGGIGVRTLGWVADHHGLQATLLICELLPLVGFVAARFLPAPREQRSA
jgi:MFS transporter, FSR family, fosmidomycin resistance protein